MIRIVDRNGEQVAQKIVSPKGTVIRYQYGVPGMGMTECSSLTEARIGIGKLPPASILGLTKPKITMQSNA